VTPPQRRVAANCAAVLAAEPLESSLRRALVGVLYVHVGKSADESDGGGGHLFARGAKNRAAWRRMRAATERFLRVGTPPPPPGGGADGEEAGGDAAAAGGGGGDGDASSLGPFTSDMLGGGDDDDDEGDGDGDDTHDDSDDDDDDTDDDDAAGGAAAARREGAAPLLVVGMPSLPKNAEVELELIAATRRVRRARRRVALRVFRTVAAPLAPSAAAAAAPPPPTTAAGAATPWWLPPPHHRAAPSGGGAAAPPRPETRSIHVDGHAAVVPSAVCMAVVTAALPAAALPEGAGVEAAEAAAGAAADAVERVTLDLTRTAQALIDCAVEVRTTRTLARCVARASVGRAGEGGESYLEEHGSSPSPPSVRDVPRSRALAPAGPHSRRHGDARAPPDIARRALPTPGPRASPAAFHCSAASPSRSCLISCGSSAPSPSCSLLISCGSSAPSPSRCSRLSRGKLVHGARLRWADVAHLRVFFEPSRAPPAALRAAFALGVERVRRGGLAACLGGGGDWAVAMAAGDAAAGLDGDDDNHGGAGDDDGAGYGGARKVDPAFTFVPVAALEPGVLLAIQVRRLATSQNGCVTLLSYR